MRRSKGGARPASRVAPIHALFAAAALGLLVMPLALAGAKPTAAASGSSLRKQVKSLKKRVAALEARTTTAPGNNPGSLSGPAGGDLIGSYPNPQIRPNAISGFEIFDGSITGADIAFKSLPGSTKIASESLGSDEIANGSIQAVDLHTQSVGAQQLTGIYERVSTGVTAPAGTFVDAFSTCNQGDRVLGGGYAFQNRGDFAVQASTPNVSAGGFENPNQWAVTAASANVNNTLFAWAVCIST